MKSNYKVNVLEVNKALKIEKQSLNGAIKVLLLLAPLSKEQKTFFNGLLKDAAKYEVFANNVRRTKKGAFTPFYCLQAAHKATK